MSTASTDHPRLQSSRVPRGLSALNFALVFDAIGASRRVGLFQAMRRSLPSAVDSGTSLK
jgi:hypothetical protein